VTEQSEPERLEELAATSTCPECGNPEVRTATRDDLTESDFVCSRCGAAIHAPASGA
jgi:predicted RNA-binding Zn-ribbon protein involved in translation (DUF1610 family)